MDEVLESIAVILTTQGEHRFYLGSLQSDILAQSTFVTSREEDVDGGFQRTLSEKRAADIASYIDNGFGSIPGAIILSAQSDANLDYNSRSKTLTFSLSPRAFKIIDGQHRVYGFKKANKTVRVPVVIYEGLSLKDEVRLFIDINTNQKPVPKELVLDIQRLARKNEDVDEFINSLYDLFLRTPGSPLLGLLSPHRKQVGRISRVTFLAALRHIIDRFGERNEAHVYSILAPYLSAMHRRCSQAGVEFTKPTIFRGILLAFPKLMDRLYAKYGPKLTQVQWLSELEGIQRLRVSALSGSAIANSEVFLEATRPKFKL